MWICLCVLVCVSAGLIKRLRCEKNLSHPQVLLPAAYPKCLALTRNVSVVNYAALPALRLVSSAEHRIQTRWSFLPGYGSLRCFLILLTADQVSGVDVTSLDVIAHRLRQERGEARDLSNRQRNLANISRNALKGRLYKQYTVQKVGVVLIFGIVL